MLVYENFSEYTIETDTIRRLSIIRIMYFTEIETFGSLYCKYM